MIFVRSLVVSSVPVSLGRSKIRVKAHQRRMDFSWLYQPYGPFTRLDFLWNLSTDNTDGQFLNFTVENCGSYDCSDCPDLSGHVHKNCYPDGYMYIKHYISLLRFLISAVQPLCDRCSLLCSVVFPTCFKPFVVMFI